ncbi:hypothetical protein ACSBR2_002228 [Camellia fascicularis]
MEVEARNSLNHYPLTVAEIVKIHELEISTLATLSSLKVLSENADAPGGCAVSVVNESLYVYLKI